MTADQDKDDCSVTPVRDGVNQRDAREGFSRGYRGSDDARMRVQNTLYLVLGA
jgi:hypothetical protein